MNFLRTESYKKGIAVSSALNFVAKLFTFLNNVIIAFYFGTTKQTDVYFYAFATAFMLATFITGFASSILIPESMRIRHEQDERSAMAFLNFFLYMFLAVSIIITAIIFINPVRIFTLLSSFNSEDLAQNSTILMLAIPLITFMIFTLFLTELLASYKYFTLPMVASIINSCFSIVFVLMFHNRFGVPSILWGLIYAYAINISILIYIMRRKLNWNFKPRFIKIERRIAHNIAFSQTGNLATMLSGYVPIYLLSGFGAGIITALNYGRQVAELPAQLITRQFAAVTGIKFNELHAQAQFKELDETFIRAAKFVIFVLIPVSAVTFLFSEELITILFKRGKFDAESVKTSSLFLRYFTLALSLMGIDAIVARMYMAAKKIKQSFIYQVCSNLFLISCVFILIKTIGVLAYPVSILIAYLLNLFIQIILFKKIIPFITYIKIVPYFFLVLFINAAAAYAASRGLSMLPDGNIFVRIAAGSVAFLLCILLLNSVFNINKDVTAMTKRAVRFGRPA